MTNKIKNINRENAIETSDASWRESEVIEGVHLKLESSTSKARIFNMSLKMATLDWTDPVLDEIEKMLDSRLINVANGQVWEVKHEKEDGRKFTTYIQTTTEEDARRLTGLKYPNTKIIAAIVA